MTEPKTCFVIGPIGEPLTDAYNRALAMLENVIAPAIAPLGYLLLRGDQIDTSGILHLQIAAQLIQADLVVADLTGANPNVYYELGIRHTLGKPCIQLLPIGERLPFDVAPMRTIIIDDRSTVGVRVGIEAIQAQVRSITTPLLTPVSVLVNVTTSIRDTALLQAAATIGSGTAGDRPAPVPSKPTIPAPQPSAVPAYVVDETSTFWASLDDLDHVGASPQLAAVVSEMVMRISNHPTGKPDTNGVYVMRSRPAVVDGVTLPAVRLSYTLDKNRVLLVHVAAEDDPLASGSSLGEN
jgi:hypothetical protein